MVKSFLTASLVVIGTTIASTPAHALSWNFSYASPNTSANLVVDTNGSSYATNTIYTISAATGTINGNAVTTLSVNPFLTPDQKFVWDGSSGALLSLNGPGFVAGGVDYNVFSSRAGNGSTLSTFLSTFLVTLFAPLNQNITVGNAAITSLSLTPATPVPFEFSPALGLGVLGGLFVAKKLSSKLLKK